MPLTQTKEQEIVGYASEKNLAIEKDALELLAKADDFRKIIDQALSENENTFFLGVKEIEQRLIKTKMPQVEARTTIQGKGFKPEARGMPKKLRILEEYDVTNQSCSEGTVKNFLELFQGKFDLLSEMLRKRHSLQPRPINRLRTISKGNAIDLVGMVFKKWVTKNGHLAFQLEDKEARCIALVMKNDSKIMRTAETILPDNVIGLKAVKWGDDMVIIKEIYFPDLPLRKQKTIQDAVSIAATSDLHVGSKLFLEKSFYKFLEWINGRIDNEKERDKVSRIKYLVISGDNADGIGIYPSQVNELNIKDISKQYETFGRLVKEIPEYIEILIIPGQHDAVRWADPKPAIPEEMLQELKGYSNIHLMGSPSWAEIEGFKTMIYHGDSLHDLIGNVSFLDSSRPAEAMVELLKRRDLMSGYGIRHPYVPEKKDFMVIKEEPDLVFIGDMHHNNYANYRGVQVINSGTWQGRTAYQVKLGHTPTPGIVPVLELNTGKLIETKFIEGENA
ncbi:MAG: metallophosphoesterase [Candidatus Diapherotrites archaeon]|nr:metallophosphoesterase [Candidatus Diapherotrites archaeon]